MSTAFYQTYNGAEEPLTLNDGVVSSERSVTIRTGGTTVYSGGEATAIDAYQSFNLADVDPSGGLQARTKTGSPRYGSLEMTDIVKVPGGVETTLQNAVSLGLVEKDQSGRWVAVPDGAARALASEAPQEAPADEGEAQSNPAIESDLADLCSAIPGTSQVALLQQMVANGEVHQNTLNRAASESGIHPSELSQRLDGVVQGFQQQAETVLRGMGAGDASRFWDWASENHKADLQKAMTDHAMERTTRGYQPLFSQYVETLADHSADDVLNAQFGQGITARKIDGKVVLSIEGHGPMTYRSAVKAGLIKVSGV